MPVRKNFPSQSAVRVLMLDENGHGLTARQTVLEEQGYVVTATKSKSHALELFAEHDYQVVITDHKMPRMNGLELIGTFRAAKPAVRIILLSGIVEALGLTAQSTGADAVLQKNAHEAPQLIRVMARVLATKAKRKSPGNEGAPKSNRHSA